MPSEAEILAKYGVGASDEKANNDDAILSKYDVKKPEVEKPVPRPWDKAGVIYGRETGSGIPFSESETGRNISKYTAMGLGGLALGGGLLAGGGLAAGALMAPGAATGSGGLLASMAPSLAQRAVSAAPAVLKKVGAGAVKEGAKSAATATGLGLLWKYLNPK